MAQFHFFLALNVISSQGSVNRQMFGSQMICHQKWITQFLALSSSITFIVKSRVEGNFANEPHASFLKKMKSLPRLFCLVLYLSGSFAILASILKAYLLLALIFLAVLLLTCAICILLLRCIVLLIGKKCFSIKDIKIKGHAG